MKNDFEKACILAEKDFSIEEIIENLNSDDDILKQITILNIEKIEDNTFALLLTNNLTNQSGPVREACAFRINELIKKYPQYFQQKEIYDKIINSFIDVNPNVVRFMLGTIEYIDDKKYILDNLMNKANILTEEVINKPRRGKVEEHVFTKKCFKIYWILETIKTIIKSNKEVVFDKNTVRQDFLILIDKLSYFEEYTVREKVAQIVKIIDLKELDKIKDRIKTDENYFVKRYK